MSTYPQHQNTLNGIMKSLNPMPKFTTKCSSDESYCDGLFLQTIDDAHNWGAAQNSTAEIIFKRKLFVISHYSLQDREICPGKTIIVKGVHKNGRSAAIDYNERSNSTATLSYETRAVNNSGPFIGIRFIFTEGFITCPSNYMAEFHSIALFGSLIDPSVQTCKIYRKQSSFIITFLLFGIC